VVRPCVLGILAAMAVLTWAPAAPARTHVITYSPFAAGAGLKAGLTATPAYGGSCDSGSFVVPGTTVFRCFAGVVIRDPCYLDAASSTPERSVVVCVAAPWEASVVRLRVSSPLNGSYGARPGGQPWALRLASGRRCVHVAGATTVVRGRRLSYGCGGHRVLFGSPARGGATWRIRQARSPGGAGMRTVAIATAWR
jgi:hypothetical protein